uniref:Small ribosomal subunit protein uS15m n=1 Tax=Equus asinus asinus TaxID=83772 RepID=A0A8C4LVD5_EQUAS
MLRAAWRALSSVRTRAVTHAPVLGLPGGGGARLPCDPWGLLSPPRGEDLGGWAERVDSWCFPSLHLTVRPSQEDDPPPSTLLKDYQNIPGIEKVDDVVKRLLSLEMASRKEKLKVKQEQLMNKVVANPEDTSSLEARIVALTVKIRNYEEHMRKHRKDKAHKRYLLMSIDQRNKMLKNLRKTNYVVFEKRKAHRRWVTKKALCIRVFQEAQKLKKQRRALKAAAAARKQSQRNPESPSKAGPEAIKENQ